MTAQEQLRDLLTRYCAHLVDKVEMVDQLLLQSCFVGAESSTSIVKVLSITHHMKGEGGTMGVPYETAAASALDNNLKRLARQDRVSQSEVQVTKELFARLRKIANQVTPQKSTLYNADLSQPAGNANSTALSRILM